MFTELASDLRPTGIEIIGETTWGTHFCNFYETQQDMLDILIPFFKTGLEHHEYCVYITEADLSVEHAEASLKTGIPDIRRLIEEKKIEIITHKEWYLKKGCFDAAEVFESWDAKLQLAMNTGFDGLRINGNAAWLERNIWDTFIEYESGLNQYIKDKKIIVMCTYPLVKCLASDVLDVARAHNSAIAKRKGNWEIFETPDTKRSKANILKRNEQLRDKILVGAKLLKEANIDLENMTEEQMETLGALKRSESNLLSIFENTGTALILLDTDLNIMLFNEIADELAILTFGKGYILGESLLDMLQSERNEEFRINCQSVLKGNHIIYETSYPVADSSLHWYQTRIFPIRNEHDICIGICISAEDITERKNAEVEREKITNDLIHRNKDLEQFSYMVSHNLRSPVANIMGFSQMLVNKEISEEDKKIFGEQINTSAHILDEVIRDLNLILKVKTEIVLKSEKVWFKGIIDNIKKTIQNTIEKENASIETDFSMAEAINGNRVYLYSIFLNLITNSIKYHQPGLPPQIKISTAIVQEKVVITFSDNGLGIDMNRNNAKIFGLYKRFHPQIKGKGIGLFMVKAQVELLGGRISINSKVNEGTTFTIELNR